jgi:hypothetical protein
MRHVAVAIIVLMHCDILLELGPLGLNWNAVVWPWNVYCICLVLLMYERNATTTTTISFVDENKKFEEMERNADKRRPQARLHIEDIDHRDIVGYTRVLVEFSFAVNAGFSLRKWKTWLISVGVCIGVCSVLARALNEMHLLGVTLLFVTSAMCVAFFIHNLLTR